VNVTIERSSGRARAFTASYCLVFVRSLLLARTREVQVLDDAIAQRRPAVAVVRGALDLLDGRLKRARAIEVLAQERTDFLRGAGDVSVPRVLGAHLRDRADRVQLRRVRLLRRLGRVVGRRRVLGRVLGHTILPGSIVTGYDRTRTRPDERSMLPEPSSYAHARITNGTGDLTRALRPPCSPHLGPLSCSKNDATASRTFVLCDRSQKYGRQRACEREHDRVRE
jgi:hypothetical protein